MHRVLRSSMPTVIVVTFAITLVCSILPSHGRTSKSVAPHSDPMLEASQIWIVVNLFGGRTSEKAVRVLKAIEGLGAGGKGIILPYSEITVERMMRLKPAFLVLSPNGIPWCRYKGSTGVRLQNFFTALQAIIDVLGVPTVGVCGGHQALALAYGGKVGPILGGENDCFPYGKNPTERGRKNVHVVTDDPIFLGLGKKLNLVQSHYDEVKRLPKGFLWLAGNKLSRYQIIRHPSRPAYGIQAHSEYYLTSRPAGGSLLRNFLEIAKTHNRLLRSPRSNNRIRRAHW